MKKQTILFALLATTLMTFGSLAAFTSGTPNLNENQSPLSTTQPARILSGSTEDLPRNLHLSWSNDTQTTMTVMWETKNNTASSIVKYSTDNSYSHTAAGTHSKPSWALGYIHTVNITTLAPGTVYNYVAGDASSGWSTPHKFKTAPDSPTSFSFIGFGDSRNTIINKPNFPGWDKVTKSVSKTDSDFLMFVGDNIFDAANQSMWEAWFPYLDRIAGDRPFMQATGNHEYYVSPILIKNYRGQFSFPDHWQYYSFNYSSIHFIVLDNGNSAVTPIGVGSAQYNWLAADLQAADADPDHPWKVVMFHRPPFCSLESNAETRAAWAPLFYQYHVDLVIDGDKHLYERTYPINASGAIKDSNISAYKWSTTPGTIYITDGCGGAPLYSPVAPQPWSIIQKKEFGYTSFRYHEENNSLEVKHYNTSDVILDSFWIKKPDNSHSPILINGNAQFASMAATDGWPGDGSEGNPYIVKGYDINSSLSTGIEIKNTSVHFTISDVKIFSNSHAQAGIRLENVSNGRIENTRVSDSSHGIYAIGCTNLQIANGSVSSNGANGLYLFSCAGAVITGLATSSNAYNGIDLKFCSNIRIENVSASANSWMGLYARLCSNTMMVGNDMSGNMMSGVYAVSCTGLHIDSGNFSSNARNGINLISCKNSTLADLEASTSGSGYNGMTISFCLNITISNCRALNNSDFGIYLDRSNIVTCLGNQVANNTLSGNMLYHGENVTIAGGNSSSNKKNGIYAISTKYLNVSNEDVKNNGNSGVYLFSCLAPKISDCSIASNVWYGIYLSSCPTAEISRGVLSSNGWHGIFMRLCDNAKLNGSRDFGNGYYGTYLSGCTNSKILGGGGGSGSYSNLRSGICVAECNGISLSSVTSRSNGWYGLQNYGSTNIITSGCDFSGNGYGPTRP